MSDLARPATANITLQRGSTPRLRVRLTSRNVRSGALTVRPIAGDVVEWKIVWPSGAVTKTSAASGGLQVDPVSRVVEFPATVADIDAIPAGNAFPYAVRILNADGEPYRFLEGTINVVGAP